jgi:hypothetical protein
MDVAPLLHELCAKLGVCLPQQKRDALIADPPADVDAFVVAVLRADGGEPEAADARLVRRVRVMVDAHLRDPSVPPPAGPPFDVYPLLYDLCVRLGYCLPPEPWDALMTDPPLDVDTFAEAVFVGEGLPSPRGADTQSWRSVRALVEQHFRSEGLQT